MARRVASLEAALQELTDGEELVSASFVIPYPPGFPIMVPGQVLTQETIDFMRKLDVKEIHGYERARGLKLLKPDPLDTTGADHDGHAHVEVIDAILAGEVRGRTVVNTAR